ncbi:hypothetical protein PJI16_00250 [Nitrospira sp. MA-1]|nr:hypothetical protein [Nitrospira sp. MA-1]
MNAGPIESIATHSHQAEERGGDIGKGGDSEDTFGGVQIRRCQGAAFIQDEKDPPEAGISFHGFEIGTIPDW